MIVDGSCNIEASLRRIILAKFGNSGQTCVAADHIYVHKSIANEFKEKAVKILK